MDNLDLSEAEFLILYEAFTSCSIKHLEVIKHGNTTWHSSKERIAALEAKLEPIFDAVMASNKIII